MSSKGQLVVANPVKSQTVKTQVLPNQWITGRWQINGHIVATKMISNFGCTVNVSLNQEIQLRGTLANDQSSELPCAQILPEGDYLPHAQVEPNSWLDSKFESTGEEVTIDLVTEQKLLVRVWENQQVKANLWPNRQLTATLLDWQQILVKLPATGSIKLMVEEWDKLKMHWAEYLQLVKQQTKPIQIKNLEIMTIGGTRGER